MMKQNTKTPRPMSATPTRPFTSIRTGSGRRSPQRSSLPEDHASVELSHRRPSLSFDEHSFDELHDPLTGLYNQTAFEMLVKDADQYRTALLVAELVGEEQLLSEQGQLAAERTLRHVGDLIKRSFRPVDHICRISNSRFGIVMSRVDSSIREQVTQKIEYINELLGKPGSPQPAVALAVGVAFADRVDPGESILEDAQQALNGLKARGETGCAFY